MKDTQKTLKQYAKEAKLRLKSGFWQDYKSKVDKQVEIAESTGVAPSKVKEYYSQRVYEDIKKPDTDEETFYLKVKKLLDEEGEVSNAIGRLTDKTVYEGLSYDEKQRYNLKISERYLKAVERYKKENLIGIGQ